LVCKLIVMLVDKFCELPVIHGANKLLGLVVGVFCGLFITWILSNLYVNSLLPILSERWPTVFVPESAETAIMKFFTKYSPIALIMLVFDKIGAKA
ncbi:MAG: hypothetical protein KBS59_02830, partial [Clostridiales bacterium]|nr:hypothetical protein [Clostridiales bacterium]